MNIDFLEGVTEQFLTDLLADDLSDWPTAIKYGEFLTALCPTLLIGHLVLCRALRHIGGNDAAIEELKICQTIIKSDEFREAAFLPELEQEEKLLGTKR
jgi:hypothetical protein